MILSQINKALSIPVFDTGAVSRDNVTETDKRRPFFPDFFLSRIVL
jgi:hypothetical protein